MAKNIFENNIQQAFAKALDEYKRGIEPPKYPNVGREAEIDLILKLEEEKEMAKAEVLKQEIPDVQKQEMASDAARLRIENLTKAAEAIGEGIKDKITPVVTQEPSKEPSHVAKVMQERQEKEKGPGQAR